MTNRNTESRAALPSLNLMWIGMMFSIFYWITESIRDVLVFQKGTLFDRVFQPDLMSLFMRQLVICLIMLFSTYAQTLKEKFSSRSKSKHQDIRSNALIWSACGIGVLYWILESVRDVFVFGKGSLLIRVFAPDPMSFWMRILAVFIVLLFGLYAQSIFDASRQSEETLKETSTDLERQMDSRNVELTNKNKLVRMLKHENTRRHRIEGELRRVNRSLKTLSASNKALVRASNVSQLLESVCHVLIQVGGYSFVWVGLAETQGMGQIRPVHWSGRDSNDLKDVGFDSDRNDIDFSVWNQIVKTGRPVVIKHPWNEGGKPAWSIEAYRRGYSSSIHLPLVDQESIIGLLNIYAGGKKMFDNEEIKLLQELSEDMAYGTGVLRSREARRLAEEERERIQEQLLQAQKMEAVGILAGGVAHDFNNLLTAILGCVDLAMMDVNKEDAIYRDLGEIQVAAQRAADLTSQLLLFSRKQPMQCSNINLNRMVKDLLKMMHRLIGEDVKVVTDLTPELWTVFADRGTLEQVLMNLSVNARDAMPDGGMLTIHTENVTITAADKERMPEAEEGRFVRLLMSDTGVGIPQETLEHIFEPFFSTKEVGKGTGLGLSVVYGIIKMYQGWIHVESQPGEGTQFEIYFPAGEGTEELGVSQSCDLDAIDGSGRRILVVEDEDKVREFALRGLSRSGYEVLCASDLKEAETIFTREKGAFHLVLSDVVLPDGSGLDLVEGLVQQRPDLGVLLSSGYTDYRSRWPVIQDRGYRFLEKPYTLCDLLYTIRDIMDGSSPA